MSEHSDQPRTTLFAVVPEWVLYGFSANAVKVYAALDRCANREREAWPSLGLLGERLDFSEPTVRRAIRELEAGGAVERVPKYVAGRQTTNSYYLRREPEQMTARPSRGESGEPVTVARGKNESQNEPESAPPNGVALAGGVSPAPKLIRVESRNLPYDAIADVCGIDVRNRVRSGEIAKASKDLREYAWSELRPHVRELMHAERSDKRSESFEKSCAQMIRERAQLYRNRFPSVELTPGALAKWWHDVAARRPGAGMSPDDIAGYDHEPDQ